MKRSEMIKLIAEKLYIYTEQGILLASETLKWLEAKGMQPPNYVKETETSHGKVDEVFYAEWEPEDEEK